MKGRAKRALVLAAAVFWCVWLAFCDVSPGVARTQGYALRTSREMSGHGVTVTPVGEVGSRALGSTLYFDQDVSLSLSICAEALDVEQTTVMGTPLADLLSGKQEGETAWSVQELDGGTCIYEGMLRLGEGRYEARDLCRAMCANGTDVPVRIASTQDGITTVVVDATAPLVHARAEGAPVYAGYDEGSTLFYGGTLGLVFAFEDASPIESVELIDAEEKARRLEVGADGVSCSLKLQNEVFTDDARVVVCDAAGNQRIWSLREQGTSTTAYGVEEVPNDSIVPGARPRKLVVDSVAPAIDIDGFEDGGTYAQAPSMIVRVRDAQLGYAALADPQRVVARLMCEETCVSEVRVGYDGAQEGDEAHDYVLVMPSDPVPTDGAYRIVVCLQDLSGNVSEEVERTFIRDTRSPVLDVTFSEGEQCQDLSYFSCERAAHLVLAERNVSADELEAGTFPLLVEVFAQDGRVPTDVARTAWRASDAKDAYCCDITFPANGTYRLRVRGADKARNVLTGARGTTVSAEGVYDSGEFVLDDEAPQILVSYASDADVPHELNGVDYFRAPVGIEVSLVDRNPDLDHVRLEDTWGCVHDLDWHVSDRDERGRVTCVATLTYAEAMAGGSLDPCSLSVHAHDLAGNASEGSADPFVVDQTPPRVVRARMSKEPSAVGAHATNMAAALFFNAKGGTDPELVLEFEDAHALESAWALDPRTVYSCATSFGGMPRESLSMRLRDSVASKRGHDASFGQDVEVFVRDVAGNVCSWQLVPKHGTPDSQAAHAAGILLADTVAYPESLVFDAVPPQVSIAGIEPGVYANEPLVARIEVDEYHMASLVRFDPLRTVATITKVAGSDAGTESSSALVAKQFEREGTTHVFRREFADDGHYQIDAQLVDYAGNISDACHLSTFTIDTTPPVVEVSWDNHDVRNEMYYNRARVATVRVTEHNFDASRFSIQTTGSIGAWEHDGDRHMCTVVFDRDASASSPHTLSVQGTDLAQNPSNEVTEQPFALDTQRPAVRLLKRSSAADRMQAEGEMSELVDGSAFSGALELCVALEDEECLDAQSIDVSVVGKRSHVQAATEFVARTNELSQREIEVRWDNLGAVEGAAPSYDIAADDVYTLSVRVADKAGNESDVARASFSLNRFGSNFYVERIGSMRPNDDGTWPNELIVEPPLVEVHEINVCGSPSDLGEGEGIEAHVVTKEHAHMTQRIERDQEGNAAGFALATSTEVSAHNPVEGWTEYIYHIRPGNFGVGSDSDFGDGGQGAYRVNICSVDSASNANSMMNYWASQDEARSDVRRKAQVVGFTLDERGPAIEDLVLPASFEWGTSFEASFYLSDAYTNGDRVSVLVDGAPVEVRWADSNEALGPDGLASHEGLLTFSVPALPMNAKRSIDIEVTDYTGQEARTVRHHAEGFCVSTLVGEGALLLVVSGALIAAYLGKRRLDQRRQERSGYGSAN